MLAFALVLLITAHVSVQGASVVNPPRNVTARVGQNVTLTCEVEIAEGERDALNWEKIVPGSSSIYIYKSIDPPEKTSDPEKYQISGAFNLHIINVDVNDGGLYSCFFYLDDDVKYSANVIVLGQPTLEVDAEVMEGESTTVRCQAEVGAQPFKLLDKALVPHISLQVFHDVIAANVTNRTEEVDGRIVNYVVAESTSAEFFGQHDSKDVTCVVKSTFTPFVAISAAQKITVVYPVKDISFGATKPFYLLGDILTCKASGRPAPQVRWRSANADDTISQTSDERLTVTQAMVSRRKNSWNCTATNTVGGTTYVVYKVNTFNAIGLGNSLHSMDFTICSILFGVYYIAKNFF